MLNLFLSLVLALHPTASNGARGPRNVALVVWNGVELLDFAGPGEVFSSAHTLDAAPAFRVYTVAASKDPIESQGFVRITPQYDFTDCPPPDLVVLPGGGTRNAKAVVPWLKTIEPECELVMSVCTGAFLVGEAGLLDGLEATTWHGALAGLEERFPRTVVHADRRFVDNGRIVTCAGVSAGIDGALYVVARLVGEESAKATARYMEYDWRPEPEATAATPAESIARATPAVPAAAAADPGAEQEGSEGPWVCPPCGPPCHTKEYDGPGNCHGCGMELVPRSSVPTAVVLLYEGADFSEVTALLSVLSASSGFLLHTVSDSRDEIRALESLSVRAQFDFEHCPDPTLFVVPGGHGALDVASDDLFLDFVREAAAKAHTTLVTGAGAAVCAAAGVGEGATWMAPDWIARVAKERGLELDLALEEDATLDRRCTGALWSARDAAAGARAALDAVSQLADATRAARTAERLGIEWQPR